MFYTSLAVRSGYVDIVVSVVVDVVIVVASKNSISVDDIKTNKKLRKIEKLLFNCSLYLI